MSSRVANEAREALESALSMANFGGEFIITRDRLNDHSYYVIYLIHHKPKLSGKVVANVWRRDDGTRVVHGVEVNPNTDLPRLGVAVRNEILKLLAAGGFVLKDDGPGFWPTWERETNLLS